MEDKYFNEFFDKLYNGKLNIYEDEEDVNINEVTKTPEQNFNDFLRDVDIALNGKIKLTKYQKNSLRNIIKDERLKSVSTYANEKNREETIDKFKKWCGENKDNKQKCEKLEKILFPLFNDFLRDVDIALNGKIKLTKYQKNSLRNIINDEELTTIYAYANEKNREETIKEFNKWCGENEDNKQKCEKLKKILYINSPFDDFLSDVEIALNDQIKLTQIQKDSLRNIITDEEFKKTYVYANEKNREVIRGKFERWCENNSDKCQKIKDKFSSNFNVFLGHVDIALNDYKDIKITMKSNIKNSLKLIIYPNMEGKSIYVYAKENNREEIIKKFNKWCGENEDNKQKCEELIKKLPKGHAWFNTPEQNFNDFLRDVDIALNNFGGITSSIVKRKVKESLRNIINDEELTAVYAYANEKNREETIKKFNKWCTCEGDEFIEKCEEIEKKCEEIKKLVNEWKTKEWRRYEKSFAKIYGGTQYFKNLKKGERDFEESKIHKLRGVISIKEIINKLTKDCKDKNYCDTRRKEQVKERITNVVRKNIETFLDHEETKVKKFDLECLEPLKLNGETIIDKNYRIEVKMKAMLDGVFATYLSSSLSKLGITNDFGKQIYDEFVDDLLKGDKFIFERIIWDNCQYFDGIILTNNIFVPKEYITLYISSKNEYYSKNKVFTLRYNIDKSEMDNFYKIIKPRDNGKDGKVSDPLEIRKLNEKEKSMLNGWYSDFTGNLFDMGKCPKKRSMDESYDSYLDQLVENFFYTGKLNIYEDEEDVNIYEVYTKTPEQHFDNFLRDKDIALKSSNVERKVKDSLRNIIKGGELRNVYAYANQDNRKKTIDCFNDWCKNNKDECGKIKLRIDNIGLQQKNKGLQQKFDDFLSDVYKYIVNNRFLKGLVGKDLKSVRIFNSLRNVINDRGNFTSVLSYANGKNIKNTQNLFDEWCKQEVLDCKTIKDKMGDWELLKKFSEFLGDIEKLLDDDSDLSKKTKSSLRVIINPNDPLDGIRVYAKNEYKDKIKNMFGDWCKGDKELCKTIISKVNKLKEIADDSKIPTKEFKEDIKKAIKGDYDKSGTANKKSRNSLRNIINNDSFSDILSYAKQKNKENTQREFLEWCKNNENECEKIQDKVNEWETKEWRIYEESFAKKYGGTQYFKNLNKGKSDFEESKIHKLRGVISIKEKISELTKDCRENNLCDITRKEQVKKRITNVVRNNIKTFLEHKETKVKKFDLECLVPIGDVIKKGFKIEVKMKTMLDGVFASYLTSPLKIRETDTIKLDDFGREIYNEFVDDLLTSNEDNFIFERIIDDNCVHFDGIILDDDIFVPKEYITLYISSKSDYFKKNKVFTLRYNIDKSEMNNFYKIIKPGDNKNDGQISEPLKIRKLNSEEKSKLNGWYSDFTDKIYEKGKCKSGQSVNESYDSYLDQLVENFFNTGKLFP